MHGRSVVLAHDLQHGVGVLHVRGEQRHQLECVGGVYINMLCGHVKRDHAVNRALGHVDVLCAHVEGRLEFAFVGGISRFGRLGIRRFGGRGGIAYNHGICIVGHEHVALSSAGHGGGNGRDHVGGQATGGQSIFHSIERFRVVQPLVEQQQRAVLNIGVLVFAGQFGFGLVLLLNRIR